MADRIYTRLRILMAELAGAVARRLDSVAATLARDAVEAPGDGEDDLLTGRAPLSGAVDGAKEQGDLAPSAAAWLEYVRRHGVGAWEHFEHPAGRPGVRSGIDSGVRSTMGDAAEPGPGPRAGPGSQPILGDGPARLTPSVGRGEAPDSWPRGSRQPRTPAPVRFAPVTGARLDGHPGSDGLSGPWREPASAPSEEPPAVSPGASATARSAAPSAAEPSASPAAAPSAGPAAAPAAEPVAAPAAAPAAAPFAERAAGPDPAARKAPHGASYIGPHDIGPHDIRPHDIRPHEIGSHDGSAQRSGSASRTASSGRSRPEPPWPATPNDYRPDSGATSSTNFRGITARELAAAADPVYSSAETGHHDSHRQRPAPWPHAPQPKTEPAADAELLHILDERRHRERLAREQRGDPWSA